MQKHVKSYPARLILSCLIPLLISFNSQAKTQVVKAKIDGIEPIYMTYKMKKVIKPCQSMAPGCWHVNYIKQNYKVLKGYRVKLSYKDKLFTTRMRAKPTIDFLNVRIREDLLNKNSTVALNVSVVN